MWTWEFWGDALERAIYTFAEAMLGYLAVNSLAEVDWLNALSVSGVAFLVTVFKCIIVKAVADGKAKKNEGI